MVLFFSSFSFSQLVITELADPNDNSGARYVEIYNVSSNVVDLTDWELRRWTNAGANPQGSGIDLSSVGLLPSGSFVLVAANGAEFTSVYGFAPDINAGTGGAADSNGDDQIAIFDAADNTIDIFGVPGEDGSGTCHEFEDGRAERIASVTASNSVWDESEWNVWADSQVSGCTSHTQQPVNAGDGIYDPGSWIGETSDEPSISSSEIELTGFIQFVGAPSAEQMIDISGSNLSADVSLSVSGDYEISFTSLTGFSTNLLLSPVSGELTSTTLYVRLNGLAMASPSNGTLILTSAGANDLTVALSGEILNPDPVLFSSEDTLNGFSHFVGTPSTEQSFEVSGNYLTDDMSINVSGEFEISMESGGGFSNSITIPTYSNATVFDASQTWNGYMNVFDLPSNGGGYIFGQPWGVADLQSTIDVGANTIELQPNFNTYADNLTDPFWVDQTTNAGNKNMEANTYVEPGPAVNGNDFTFVGTVSSHTLDVGYSAKYFIKALDPNAGYADAFGGSKTFDLPLSGDFSVSATAAEIPAGLIVQYGFSVVGPNANPVDAAALGSVLVNGSIVPGEVASTSVYVRLNGAVQNNNQTGILTVASASVPGAFTVNAGNFYYSPTELTINVGDTVYWVNDGGFHNVNFSTNTVTGNPYNNPESFVSSPTSDTELFSYVFNTAGTYQYDCSVGSHAANGMIGTIIVLENSDPEPANVVLSGETLDYSSYTIGQVTTNDANGVADSLGLLVSLEGVVHCIDFDGNEGLSFTIIDIDNNGINVFNFNDVSSYEVTEGDLIKVWGIIDQYNGLTEVIPDSIEVLSTGNAIVTPSLVTGLNEDTESQWITIQNVDFVTPIATFASGSSNIDVTDGTNVYTLRIDSDTDIPESSAPQGPFDVTGVGGQYDSSDPYDSGYQLFPCGLGSFVPSSTTQLEETMILNVFRAYPNPFNNMIHVSLTHPGDFEIVVRDVQGRILLLETMSQSMDVDTKDWCSGVYMISLQDSEGHIQLQKVIK